MKPFYSLLTFSVLSPLAVSSTVYAQIGNAPFSFNNAGGGVGPSVAGREAIINDKLYGIRPDNLVKAPGGQLLDVQKGPGGSAFVSYPGTGQIIPQYRGTNFREYHPEMQAGMFNGFFLPTLYTSAYPAYAASTGAHSTATVSTWTARVTSGGMPVSYTDGNVVDSWTGQVLVMDRW